LTADGRLLWEFEALLHDVFGSHPSFATGIDNTNFACAGMCSPHATWDEYHYTFARSHGSTLSLTSRTFPAGAFGNYPERAPHARVVLAAGSFNYDPRDDADVVRIARLIADEPELASLDHDDLRTALASVRNGSTFTF